MATGIVSQTLGAQLGVAEAFGALYRDASHVVWLDSQGDRGSGRSVLATGEPIELERGRELAHLREVYQARHLPLGDYASVPLGFIGVLAYDVARETLGIESLVSAGSDSTSRGLWVTRSLEFLPTGEIVAHGLSEDEGFVSWVAEIDHALSSANALPGPELPPASRAIWRDSTADYRTMIEKAFSAIRDGEVYQICLTTSVKVETDLTDWELHTILREISPTHHQGLLRLGSYSLVSASPETFLTIETDRTIRTKPIKGTRPRGLNAEEDRQLVAELRESDKERAENLMIVDLMRNDLQKVCELGSVHVSDLFEVETYSSVHQLVSTVEGTLDDGFDPIDALAACFPAGSMTGAPKHRAVSLLAQWESEPRGVYSGAWGWWRLDGSMEWAMTIRSALVQGGSVSVGVGGGITWSSVPSEEIAEVGHKARRILEALGAVNDQYS